jgi:Uncharacterized protein conserved in bacteria
MSSLHNLQTRFAEAVFNPGSTGFERHIRPNGLTGARRLRVYRNNVFVSLTEALRVCYPVINHLVGERFFDYTAEHYIRVYPSTSGNLHDFGREFAAFIGAFSPASHLLYLADVARLEWAYQEVFHAAEPAPLDLFELSSVPPDRYSDLRFELHPASRLVASDYPILRIWQVNQPDYVGDATVDLSEGGVNLLVIRRSLKIERETLSAGEYVLLKALAEGRIIGYASAYALDVEPALDLPACLRRHVARHTLVGFSF